MSRLLAVMVATVLVAMVLAACGGDPPPPYPEDTMNLAMETMEQRPEVSDSDLYQKEQNLFLILVVAFGTPETVARRSGEDFVRLVKTLGPEDPPSIDAIGEGHYEYVVGVFYPGNVLIDRGIKRSSDDELTWGK